MKILAPPVQALVGCNPLVKKVFAVSGVLSQHPFYLSLHTSASGAGTSSSQSNFGTYSGHFGHRAVVHAKWLNLVGCLQWGQ